MMPGVMSQIPAGSGLQLVRVYDGVVCAVPPLPPVMGELPEEVLTVVATFLGMRKPRKKDDDDNARYYPWAARKVVCPPGSQLMIAKVERGNAQSEAYLLTFFVHGGQAPIQVTAWNAIGVLAHTNNWLSSSAVNPHPHLHAIRVEGELDLDDESVFVVRIAATAMLSPEDEAPNPKAPWTLLCEDPRMRIGLVSDPIIEHVTRTIDGETEAFYAARFQNAVLDIGQRLSPEELEEGGEDDDCGETGTTR